MWVHSLRGALWLVVHDAAVGVQGEWETAVKPLHGLIEGRQPKSYGPYPWFRPHGSTRLQQTSAGLLQAKEGKNKAVKHA